MTSDTHGGVRHIQPAFVDARGTIADILEREPIDSVTLITSHRGAVRGNHYHNDTVQWVYVVHGRMRITTQMPGHEPSGAILSQGDLIRNAAGERHAMRALEDTTFLVLTRGPRSGASYEADTYRLAGPDLLELPDPV